MLGGELVIIKLLVENSNHQLPKKTQRVKRKKDETVFVQECAE